MGLKLKNVPLYKGWAWEPFRAPAWLLHPHLPYPLGLMTSLGVSVTGLASKTLLGGRIGSHTGPLPVASPLKRSQPSPGLERPWCPRGKLSVGRPPLRSPRPLPAPPVLRARAPSPPPGEEGEGELLQPPRHSPVPTGPSTRQSGRR